MTTEQHSIPHRTWLQRQAHGLIPGGCHTYAKGDDQFPWNAPSFIDAGKGCRVVGVDGREFIEYGMGLRAVTLGHAYQPVLDAVSEAIQRGNNFTRPALLEVTAAKALVDLWDVPLMVKFCKNGSDATTAAVRLARAHTGRERVACCRQQPFLSVDDWFIGTTPMNAGIPQATRDLVCRFSYNDIDSLRALFDQHPQQIAAIVMEAATYEEPQNGFLHQVQGLCEERGAVFVLDEMITGFRWSLGGARQTYALSPDLATYGKALGNGFSVSALVGKPEIMARGGLDHSEDRVFLLSYTHGAEPTGLAAACETIRTYCERPVIDTLYRQGTRLRDGVERLAREKGVDASFSVMGRPCNLIFVTRDAGGHRSQSFRTLFLQEMIRNGVLAPSFVVSYAHDNDAIDLTLEAVSHALDVYRRALEDGIDRYLEGPASQPVFRRHN